MDLLELDFEQAKARHILFKTKLRSILYGAVIDETPVLSHFECAVGKWIYGHALVEYGHIPEILELEKVHASLHTVARELVALYKSGKVSESRDGLAGMEKVADRLILLFEKAELKIKTERDAKIPRVSPEQLSINLKELNALHQTVLDLDIRIREQTALAEAVRKEAEANELRFRNTVLQAPVGISILRGADFIPEMANATYLQLVDKTEDEFVGKPLFDSLPEVKSVVEPLLNSVLHTGVPFYANELEVTLNRAGTKGQHFFNLAYQPLRETDGTITGIIVVANEVTSIVVAKHSLAQSELQFRNLVTQSPIAMTIFKGRDFLIDIANETLLNNIWKRKLEDVQGKSILTVFPELNDQKYPELLRRVYETGVAHRESESIAIVDGVKYYLDFEYSPLRDPNGNVFAIMVTVNDVTEKVSIRQQINDAAERLRLATEGTQMATWDLNLQTREIIHSPRLAAIFGFPDTKILTHPEMRAHIHPDDVHTIVEKAFDEALKNGIYFYESRVVHPDKTIRWIRTRGKVIFGADQTPLRMVGTMIDFTETKLDQQRLIESQERLAFVIDVSELGIWELDLQTEHVIYSRRYREIFGYPDREDVTRDEFYARLHPEYRTIRDQAFATAMASGVLFYESPILWPDHSLHWVEVSGKVSFSENGKAVKMIGTARDITGKRKAQSELEESEQKFRTLADSMPQFIWTGDEKGVLNYFNRAVYDYSGLSREQIAKEGWLQIVHPDDQEENIAHWVHSVSTGDDFQFEHRFRRLDGEYRWQISRAIPQRDAKGKIVMWVGTSTDIHDKKVFMDELEVKVQQRTQELKITNEELRKSNNELEQFAYVASHDLQEPLRKIQTFATRILEIESDNMTPKGKDYITRMQGSSRRMQQLILDLLSFSRTNTAEKHFERTDMNLLLEKVKDQLSDLIDRNKVVVRSSVLPDLNVIAFQFEQLFTNIIGNAIKFARADAPIIIEVTSGKVHGHSVSHPSADGSVQYTWISIKDNGIGFDQQFAERIFQVFQRLHGKEAYEGTGIGLAICKKIAENHQGFITAVSQPGNGATFTIFLPDKI